MTYTKARRGLKAFFNEFCETYKDPTERKLDEFHNQFKKSIKAAFSIFGTNGFRLRHSHSVNASVFQAVCVSFTEHDLGALTRSRDAIHEAYIDLISTDDHWVSSTQSIYW